MNPDASQNGPNDPRPAPAPIPGAAAPARPAATRAPAPASSGGLASVLKVALPLALLVGVVFGITYITMYAPQKGGDDGDTKPGTSVGTAAEPPLRFFASARAWDPPMLTAGYRDLPLLAPSAIKPPPEETGEAFSYALQDRAFQGIYESSNEIKRATQFWFENRNPQGVTLELKGVSCSACSGGRVAAIPPEVTRGLLQSTAVGALPIGPFAAPKLALVEPAAALSQLKWEAQAFKDYRESPVKYHVPGAAGADKWSPQWGILELQYEAKGERKEPLTADFAAQVDGAQEFAMIRFAIMFQVAPACAVSPASIDAGRIDASSTERPYGLLVYSATRGPGSEFGDLEKPSAAVEAPPGSEPVPFLAVLDDKTVRVPEDELPELQNQLQQRVRSAYRLTVVLRPKVGERRMDIGRFERTISITAGGVAQQVKVTATVRGPVWLDGDRNEIALPSFPGRRGLTKHATDLVTEKPGVELALLKDECKPAKFVYELEKQPDRGGEGHYKLLVTVPPGQFGTVKGEVVLEVKGPHPQKMRIPVTGSGTFGQ